MKLKHLFSLAMLPMLPAAMQAAPVQVTMNTISTTMTLTPKGAETPVETGAPSARVYNFDAAPGTYLLTGYATDGKTVNGTIELTVADQSELQEFKVFTITAYASNSGWVYGTDYTMEPTVTAREGGVKTITMGNSTTANRKTFLTFNGNSYNVAYVPSESRKAEGYMTGYRSSTVTANVTANYAIPLGGEYSITVPNDAELFLGIKFTHFTDFTAVEPKAVRSENGGKTYTYELAVGQVYNYRTWKAGGLTHGGYFTFNSDETKCPKISFSDTDYASHSPKEINHSAQSNQGYETGDIFVNATSQGTVKLNVGETFKAHAMRSWELNDNTTNNYFIEPDFHYTVVGLDGKPSTGVVEIEQNVGSAWANIKAIAKGTAIVMVTYDGINLNYYSGADKKDYLGGQFWGAIWPENTAVYVVTVGEAESSVVPDMIINEAYNLDTKKSSGKFVDAEHDVFYYLDTEPAYAYTFTPVNAASVEIAYPAIGEQSISFSGFGKEGVTVNADGSVTLLLKEGRQIVRLTDAAGRASYQVLRARPCHREIVNATRQGSKIYQPGDKVKIQYSGLFHPANKLAGIYNMSAYVTYNGVPNGSSLILGSGQYTFGSAASAQAVTVTIPEDFDVEASKSVVMNDGVIQVNGFGDPIGNHRYIDPVAGRSPNFTAVAHKTYFGAIPSIEIPVSATRYFDIKVDGVPENADFAMTYAGKRIEPGDNGLYSGTYGTYSVVVKAKGYECFRHDFDIADDAEGEMVFKVEMVASDTSWDGETMAEPTRDAEGTYLISNGAELAYFANMVNTEAAASRSAKLTAEINLGNYEWIPIGEKSAKSFIGEFDGQGHAVKNLYVNNPAANYQGLFGNLKSGDNNAVSTIKNLSVTGSVSGKMYVGGLVGYASTYTRVINCMNHASVNAAGNYSGGVIGVIYGYSSVDHCANFGKISGAGMTGGVVGGLMGVDSELHNCFNTGTVTGTTNVGGVVGTHAANQRITDIFSIGEAVGSTASSNGACVGSTASKSGVENAFSLYEAAVADNSELVTPGQMASGEIAYRLGDAFFQTIGEEAYPMFEGLKVYYDEADNTYYNLATGFILSLGEGNDDIIVANNVVTLPINATYELAVAATPAAARLPEMEWTSSDNSVAEIDDNGRISAVGKGVATITVSAVFGSDLVSYTCAVNVVGAHVSELSLDAAEVSLHVTDNPSATLAASFGPEYADEPTLVWTSSDEAVATVKADGALSATVTAVHQGKATIKVALANNPGVAAMCEVEVLESSGIAALLADGNESVTVYDLAGRLLLSKASEAQIKALTPGFYIFKRGDIELKVFVR